MPKVSGTACPCARLLNDPLIKPSPVFFTTVRFVPAGGAKFSVKVALPLAVNPFAVTGMSPAEFQIAFRAATRVTATVYTFLVTPSCAVTVTVTGLLPTASPVAPAIRNVALVSETVGVTVMLVTLFATVVV